MDSLPGKCRHSIKYFLLLVNLFVARTLGNCPKPVLEENIIFTNEALLMNDFKDNVEITLTCANGYVKDSGTGTIKCTDGVWSDLDLTCKKKDCGIPHPQPHMTFDLSQGTLFGAVAVVICDKGYMVTGSSYKHCYNTGWTGKSTKCLIITCEIPEKVANSINSWNSEESPKYGESISFFCNEGYTLTGKDSIMCTEDGEYDFPAPQCLRVTKEDLFTTKLVTTQTSAPTTPTQGVTKEDLFTTKLVTTQTSAPTTPTQETSVTTTTSATTTGSGHRVSTLTARASPTVSLSAPETSVTTTTSATTTGSSHRDSTLTARASPTVSLSTPGEDILTDEDNTTTTTATTPLSPTVSYYFPGDRSDDIVDTKKDIGYTPVIISVVCVSLVAFIVVLFIHKLLLRRKGSYDTREDLKPELLQFQNL